MIVIQLADEMNLNYYINSLASGVTVAAETRDRSA
jgi:hypothetical protein